MLQKVIPVTSAARVYTGPRVQGTHPVLVSFETYSDRSVEELEGFIQKKMCICRQELLTNYLAGAKSSSKAANKGRT